MIQRAESNIETATDFFRNMRRKGNEHQKDQNEKVCCIRNPGLEQFNSLFISELTGSNAFQENEETGQRHVQVMSTWHEQNASNALHSIIFPVVQSCNNSLFPNSRCRRIMQWFMQKFVVVVFSLQLIREYSVHARNAKLKNQQHLPTLDIFTFVMQQQLLQLQNLN